MKDFFYFLPFLVVSVALLVGFELKKKKAGIYVTKPISTLLVIGACLMALSDAGTDHRYILAIAAGLLFSFGGDMALMFQERPTPFRIGLVLFLVAHVVYGAAFLFFAGPTKELIFIAALFFGLGTAVYLYLLPGLGAMRASVGIYVLIISFMAASAVSTLFSSRFDATAAILVTAGSLLFYLSDVILALNRFRIPMRYNRLSLIPYYAGQFLIAVSAFYY